MIELTIAQREALAILASGPTRLGPYNSTETDRRVGSFVAWKLEGLGLVTIDVVNQNTPNSYTQARLTVRGMRMAPRSVG